MSVLAIADRTPAINGLFAAMCALGASDLHLSVGAPPLVRKDGRIQTLDPAMPVVTATPRAPGE